jgi:bifunctional ADP-heptose synthase (sugar kinase/adenylyltransferase)
MLHQERMEIIDALRGVDYVTGWDDGSQTVVGALELLMPNVFTKGGDRSSANRVPEVDICEKIGCRISYGVGGTDKIQSSSDLIKNM